jgi:two-component system KDP operon response regulator KdpE
MSAEEPVVLLVEDEAPMRRFLRASLLANGFRVLEAVTAREALALATSHNPSLVLLDLGLPDGDGIDVTRQLREWCTTPIIVISARGREDDKVTALDAGADDYLTKPFGVNELLARIRVAQRHARTSSAGPASPVWDLGGLVIDTARHTVRVEGKLVRLTPTEYRLLVALAKYAGRVLTHKQIIAEVWSGQHGDQTQTLRVHMASLRKKIEVDSARPRWLLNEPGVGYRLEEQRGETRS